MIKEFAIQLKDALKARKRAVLPAIRWMIPAVAIFTLLFCVSAVYLVPGDKPANLHFQEGGAITAMSAIFLALACGFAIASNLIYLRIKGKHQLLWIIMALGFGFLAFDELLMFHERVGRIVIERIMPQTVFRNWNDVIVIMYGVIAVPLMILLLPRLLKYRLVLELFVVGFLFYAVHTFIDSTTEPKTLTSDILEESAKLFSVAFLALGSFTGFIGNVWQNLSGADETGLPAAVAPDSYASKLPPRELNSGITEGQGLS